MTIPARDGDHPDAAALPRCPPPGQSEARSARRASWWTQALTVGWLWWIYDAVANRTGVRLATALANGTRILRNERRFHLDAETSMSRWTAGHHAVALLVADFYDLAHLGVTFVVLAVLWWNASPRYRHQRNVLISVNIVAFAVFLVLPVAPPRMLPGFVDVVAQSNAIGSWHSGTLGTLANELAAFPSLHVAWALWCAWAVSSELPRRAVRVAAATYVAVTIAAVLATANHFLFDVIGGIATFALCRLLVAAIEHRRATPPTAPATTARCRAR